MDKNEFMQNLKNASPNLNLKFIDDTLIKSLSPAGEKFEGFMNLIIVIEEFAECQQEVSKFLRNKEDSMSLLEETADALIGIRYIQKICNISDEDLIKAVNVKIQRQANRNKEHNA